MTDLPRPFHKPVRRPGDVFDRNFVAEDAAEVSRIAHATATALLERVRSDPNERVLQRLLSFTADHGIDTIAQLWARSSARSLPGALWRLYLLQLMVHDDARTSALLYERGRARLRSADEVVAGAPSPAGPEELVALADEILRGVFAGDFALALDRAASFCTVQAAGAADLADDSDAYDSERAGALTARALRLTVFAEELAAAASLWRRGALS